MKTGIRITMILHVFAAAVVLFPAQGEAARCKLSTTIGQLVMIERNIATLEKQLRGTKRAAVIPGLRSQIAALRNRGRGFPTKAAPIDKECQAIGKKWKKISNLKKRRDRALKTLRAQRRDISAKRKRIDQAIKTALQNVRSQGCPMRGVKLSKEKYKVCKPIESRYSSFRSGQKAKHRALGERDRVLYRKILKHKDDYRKAWQAVKKRHDAYKQAVNGYNAARKSWTGDMRKVWQRTAILSQEFQKARRAARVKQRSRGGELGKLSGPMAPGKSGRSPGSGKLPPGVRAKEGGAKGQAKAAAATGRAGVGSRTKAGAAFEAGRVFDRGDVKYPKGKAGAGAVDARGIKPRAVSERVRKSDGWQKLDRREKVHRTARAKAQRKIDAIKKKLQAGNGNKGQLQVDLVRASEQKDKAQSKINVVKVEKESFSLTLEEKPAAKGGASRPVKGRK